VPCGFSFDLTIREPGNFGDLGVVVVAGWRSGAALLPALSALGPVVGFPGFIDHDDRLAPYAHRYGEVKNLVDTHGSSAAPRQVHAWHDVDGVVTEF
jgi:hypothetical protein